MRTQNARSLAELEGDSRYGKMLAEARAILNSRERIPRVTLRGAYAYNLWQDEAHVRGLWRRMPIAAYVDGKADWDVLLDVDQLAKTEGENWVFEGVDCLAPAFDRCVMTLSRGGSDAAVLREFDLNSRSFVDSGFVVPEAKSGVAWIDADTLLVATDFGPGTQTESGYPRQVRRWKRGTPLTEAEVVLEGSPKDVGVWPSSVYAGGRYHAFIRRMVVFFEFASYRLQGDAAVSLPLPAKSSSDGGGGLAVFRGRIIVRVNEPWTYASETFPLGSIVAYDPAADTAELLFAPEERVVINKVFASEQGVLLELLDNIKGRLVRLTPADSGWIRSDVALPRGGVISVGSVQRSTGNMLVTFEDPTTPDSLYFVEGAKAKVIRSNPPFFNADDVVSRQYEATSADGTKVPFFVVAKRSVIDSGPAPTIQYGYGGFQVPELPDYSGTTGKLWIERGGVYVVTNIRGGGEFGPAWHQAGLKTKRQRIYDDFYAVSKRLIDMGITRPDQLGILGGSNGGLLVGVAMTQRPKLYGAIGIGVPLLDMLRYHLLLAGASWAGEYGSPDVPEERAFLASISPYHNLKREQTYPRPFFFTSTKDDRVHPGHARKMARKMAEYGQPFLYYENTEGGHSAAANQDQRAKQTALLYTYFARELGLK